MKLNIDKWKISQNSFEEIDLGSYETIFTISNGFVGTRGNYIEKDYKHFNKSTYINGFFDTEPIKYGEKAFGYAKERQKMIEIPSSKFISLYINDERVILNKANIKDYKRTLNLQKGIVETFIKINYKNYEFDLLIESFASMVCKEVIAFNYKILNANFKGNIKFICHLEDIKNIDLNIDDPRLDGLEKEFSLIKIDTLEIDKNCVLNKYITDSSKLNLNILIDAQYDSDIMLDKKICDNSINYCFNIEINQNEEKNIIIYNGYFKQNLKKEKLCYENLKQEQINFYKKVWEVADIKIKNKEEIQASIRYNIFNLVQSVGRDGLTNICAKGLSGEGYDGHYFWDTEIYVMPFFTYNFPEVAKKLIEYRYSILQKAKERAEELSFKGALYPWRTINGNEASAYYPAGTAQIHINADIAYAIQQYFYATKDYEFMAQKCIKILIEICRFYYDYADYIEGKGYCFNGVTGPDEYSALVNNNFYTNVMIKNTFEFLISLSKKLLSKGYLDKLPLNCSLEEIEKYNSILNKIYVKKTGNIFWQDDTFLERKQWDFEKRPLKPLLLHYHPMIIYKHQVLKQADLILALYLQGHKYTKEEKLENYNFYEPLTTHDSSLSECIHGILACEIGKLDIAYKYFEKNIYTDLYDKHNNVKYGVHIASMAGSWLSIVAGFGGFRIKDEKIYLSPILPKDWEEYSFNIRYKNRLINVLVGKNIVLKLLEGKPINVVLFEEEKIIS